MGFSIPIQKSQPEIERKITVEAISRWRSRLPMGDTGTTSKKLFAILTEMNNCVLDTNIRFEILELLRPPLQMICQSLKKHYINQATPLNKQKLKVAQLSQTLQMEAAAGYKIIIEEICTNKNSDKKNLPIAIFRAMHYLSMITLRRYQLYSPAPKETWLEINTLYKIAINENISRFKLDDLKTTNSPLCIENCYLHIIILAATNPYQWRQIEQELLFTASDKWIPLAEIRNLKDKDHDKPGIYIIDLDKDVAPNPLSLDKIPETNNCIIFDLYKITKRLQEIIHELQVDEMQARIKHDGEPEYSVPLTTVKRLEENWHNVIKRNYQRFDLASKIKGAFGLSAVHFYSNKLQEFNSNKGLELAKDKFNNGLESESQAGQNLALGTIDIEFDTEANSDDMQFNKSTLDYPYHICTMVNVSPAGSCIRWEDKNLYPPMQAGEIVALKSELESNSLWSIGVIRWLKHDENKNLNIGIQTLAPHARAGGAQIIKGGEAIGYFLRCLILPEIESLGFKSTLITPILPFKEGKDINLYTEGGNHLIRASLTKEIHATGNFRQFEYSSDEKLIMSKEELENETIAGNEKLKHQEDSLNYAKQHENDVDTGSIWDEL